MDKVLKADFHIHTRYSLDCNTSLEDIVQRCLEMEINCIAITDHDAIEGSLKMQSLAPFTVIAAEEVLTSHGEVIGLFLKEWIPSGLPIEQAFARIRAQGGLVCLPHPFDTFRGLRLDTKRLEDMVGQVDIIEVFNARSPIPRDSNKARDFARKHSLPGTVGSDAHSPGEIGHTYIEMPAFNGTASFLKALSEGRIHRHRSSPLVHFGSTWAKIKKAF